MLPSWKKWLSYITPVHLETTGSAINDILEVYLVRNRLRLTTHDAIYSYDDQYLNYTKTFQKIRLPEDGADVLILGFGLGSIPIMLEKKFKKKYNYTAVEIDETVLSLFSRYQMSRLNSSLEIHQGDAAQFMRTQTRQYDIICVDAFVGEFVPDHLKEDEFLENLKRAVAPDGLILWNMLYDTKFQKNEVDHFAGKVFAKHFPDAFTYVIMGNIIIMNRSGF